MDLLINFASELKKDDLRAKVVALVPAFHQLRELGRSLIVTESEDENGRDRILAYLRRYPQQPIDGDELMVVSGVAAWERLVRELRVRFGWWIYRGDTFVHIAKAAREAGDEAELASVSGLPMRPDQYILMRTEEDRDAAYRWNVLRELRTRRKASVTTQMKEYFRRNVGHPITGEELKALAGDSPRWARAVRELRTEADWPIATGRGDGGRDDLGVGVYLLEKDCEAEEVARRVVRDGIAILEGARCFHWRRRRARRSGRDRGAAGRV